MPVPIAVLDQALPWLSPLARAMLAQFALTPGRGEPCATLAQRAGCRDRHQLARLLKREGLPNAEELSAWLRVLSWLYECERTGRSLCQQALALGLDPASCYRTVTWVTGLKWSAVRARGFNVMLVRFLDRCRTTRTLARAPYIASMDRSRHSVPLTL
jgi:hypothetical protein